MDTQGDGEKADSAEVVEEAAWEVARGMAVAVPRAAGASGAGEPVRLSSPDDASDASAAVLGETVFDAACC